MIDFIERANLLNALEKRANEIITENHVKFDDFYGATTSYDYNCRVAHLSYYKKITGKDYFVLLVVLKREYDRLDNWLDIYPEDKEYVERCDY